MCSITRPSSTSQLGKSAAHDACDVADIERAGRGGSVYSGSRVLLYAECLAGFTGYDNSRRKMLQPAGALPA